ncbi:hypothetical protein [Frankia sp. R82]|uniref:hypothetical protein n=1 Tax=Frankia sp. R82 TaxID=2950553 RepID=UPI0020431F79|nr:hypothetical protein [Frankia sp. R82]MCM3886144.1 hypothetical protein [Frankia sp. R82]
MNHPEEDENTDAAVFEDIAAVLRGDTSFFGPLSPDSSRILGLLAYGIHEVFVSLATDDARTLGETSAVRPYLSRVECDQVAELVAGIADAFSLPNGPTTTRARGFLATAGGLAGTLETAGGHTLAVDSAA